MKILVDENVPRRTVRRLIEQGHDVKDLRSTAQQDLEDAALWELAQREKRLLISTDRGFLGFRDSAHSGMLVVLLRRPDRLAIHGRIMGILEQFAPDQWPGMTVKARDDVHSVRRRRGRNEEGAP